MRSADVSIWAGEDEDEDEAADEAEASFSISSWLLDDVELDPGLAVDSVVVGLASFAFLELLELTSKPPTAARLSLSPNSDMTAFAFFGEGVSTPLALHNAAEYAFGRLFARCADAGGRGRGRSGLFRGGLFFITTLLPAPLDDADNNNSRES